MAAAWEDDEHELCNDDGFVYKRRKRRRLEEEAQKLLLLSAQSQPSAADLEKSRKQRRKVAAQNVKERYRKEILQWELLSNSLSALEERTNKRQQDEDLRDSRDPRDSAELDPAGFEPQLDELLRQVEAQRAILDDISTLCDTVEAVCRVEEERRRKPFFELPVWETPQSIFASLCEDDDDCNGDADDT